MNTVTRTYHHGGCPHDCPDTCAMVFEVEAGKLVGVRGNADHPLTRGGLCVKLKDYEKRHYHPDRLLHPLIKRNGMFERASWDEALDLVVSKFKELQTRHGKDSIGVYSGSSLTTEKTYLMGQVRARRPGHALR